MTCKQELPVVLVLSRFTVAPPQASDGVGAVNVGVAVHSIVALAPWPPMVGVGQVTVVHIVQVSEISPLFVTMNRRQYWPGEPGITLTTLSVVVPEKVAGFGEVLEVKDQTKVAPSKLPGWAL